MKIKQVVILVILVIIVFLLVPMNTVRIEDALVNENNGDIAFTYIYDGYEYVTWLYLYNSDGELLFKQNILTHGDVLFLEFVDDKLCAYFGSGDIVEYHRFERNGKSEVESLSVSLLKREIAWHKWDYSYGKRSFVSNGKTYVYECVPYPKNLFKSSFELRIEENDGNTITIFEKSTKE